MSSSTDVLSACSLHEAGTRTPPRRPHKSGSSSPGQISSDVSEEVQDEIDQMLDNISRVDEVFQIINKIGSGTFSSVYVARLKKGSPEQLFALKHIIPTSHPSRIESELRCLYEIGGLNNVMGVKACFRERDHVVIVMPYFAHERFQDYVQVLTVAEVQEYMRNMLISLRRVHQVDIIHRDVKPSNFLFNRNLKKYALVDFGLAQKAPVALQKMVEEPLLPVKPEPIKPDSDIRSTGGRKTTRHTPDQRASSPRKRKMSGEDVENDVTSPCKKRAMSNSSPGLAVIDTNKQDITIGKQNKDVAVGKADVTVTPPSPDLLKPAYTKSVKSPRRLLLTKRAMDQQRVLHDRGGEKRDQKKVVVLEKDGKSMYKAMSSSCACFGRPVICSICMARQSQHAPRAGTPGFRAPEVLMKCPDQSTAVDIWSSGVIFISLLSGRYPFFKAPDDLTALAQIISIIGSEQMKNAALTFGKHMLCSPKTPAVDLDIMCRQLRKSTRPARQFRAKGDSQSQILLTDWDRVPKSAFSLLKRLLDPNPSTRITADDALQHEFFSEEIPPLSDSTT